MAIRKQKATFNYDSLVFTSTRIAPIMRALIQPTTAAEYEYWTKILAKKKLSNAEFFEWHEYAIKNPSYIGLLRQIKLKTPGFDRDTIEVMAQAAWELKMSRLLDEKKVRASDLVFNRVTHGDGFKASVDHINDLSVAGLVTLKDAFDEGLAPSDIVDIDNKFSATVNMVSAIELRKLIKQGHTRFGEWAACHSATEKYLITHDDWYAKFDAMLDVEIPEAPQLDKEYYKKLSKQVNVAVKIFINQLGKHILDMKFTDGLSRMNEWWYNCKGTYGPWGAKDTPDSIYLEQFERPIEDKKQTRQEIEEAERESAWLDAAIKKDLAEFRAARHT